MLLENLDSKCACYRSISRIGTCPSLENGIYRIMFYMNNHRVIEMNHIKIPNCPVRHGKEAIYALQTYVKDINGADNWELTETQKEALTRVAQALISSIVREY